MDIYIVICIVAYAAIVISAFGIAKKDERVKAAQRKKEKEQG